MSDLIITQLAENFKSSPYNCVKRRNTIYGLMFVLTIIMWLYYGSTNMNLLVNSSKVENICIPSAASGTLSMYDAGCLKFQPDCAKIKLSISPSFAAGFRETAEERCSLLTAGANLHGITVFCVLEIFKK